MDMHITDLITRLSVAALLAIIPAAIASHKGRSFLLWYVYGLLLWIVAFIHALVLEKELPVSARHAHSPTEEDDSTTGAIFVNEAPFMNEAPLPNTAENLTGIHSQTNQRPVFRYTIPMGVKSWWIFLLLPPINRLGGIFFEHFTPDSSLKQSIVFMGIAFSMLAYMAAAVLYFVWLYSSNSELRRIGVQTGFSPIWAVLVYLLPIVNLWLPYQYTAELYRAVRFLTERQETTWKDSPLPFTIPLWWIAVLAFLIASTLRDYTGTLFPEIAFWCALGLFLWWMRSVILLQKKAEASQRTSSALSA